MNRKLTAITLAILIVLIAVPSFICGYIVASIRGEMIQTTTVNINSNNSELTEKVNINEASKSELDTLIGVSDCKVNSIVENRPYTDIYQLLERGVVGEDTFNKIKDKIKL